MSDYKHIKEFLMNMKKVKDDNIHKSNGKADEQTNINKCRLHIKYCMQLFRYMPRFYQI